MSTILITGGAGFIGSHLAEAALAQGNRVLILDDLSSGNVENLRAIRKNPALEFVADSVTNKYVLAELIDQSDIVFHLAATVGVFNIIESPVATILNNIGGTEAVLQLASKKKKKVIVTSTSEVYGKSTAIPFREDGDLVSGPTCRSRWSYASSKIIDEFLALAYWREQQVPTVVVRPFNCTGPRQSGRYGMVVPRFITQALRGQDVTVYGDGTQSRSFTYVSDVVEWLLALSASDKAVGEVFNLGNPNEITITDLAQRIISLTGSTSKITYTPYDEAYESGFEDIERRTPDITKVKAITGHAPAVGLEEALRRTAESIAQNIGAELPLLTNTAS